jgi:hypothetical protein
MFAANREKVTWAEENYMKWRFTINISNQFLLGRPIRGRCVGRVM